MEETQRLEQFDVERQATGKNRGRGKGGSAKGDSATSIYIKIFVPLLIGILGLVYFLKPQNELIEKPSLDAIAGKIAVDFGYLKRDQLKFAVYNTELDKIQIYSTLKNSTEIKLEETLDEDPRLYDYDIVTESLIPKNDFLEEVNKEGEKTIIFNGEEFKLNMRNLSFINNQWRENCVPGICTVGDYLKYMGVESKVWDDTPIKNLYKTCSTGIEINKCPNNSIFDIGLNTCVEPVSLERREEEEFRVEKHSEGSYRQIKNGLVKIVKCVHGVDSSGIRCNSVKCVTMNGFNGNVKSEQLKDDVYVGYANRCEDGQVIEEIECSNRLMTKSITFLNHEYIVKYPEEYFVGEQTPLTCRPTKLKMIRAIPAVHIHDWNNYRALTRTAGFTVSGSGTAVPAVIIPKHGIFPTLQSNRAYWKDGRVKKFQTQKIVVYNNTVYQSIYKTPPFNNIGAVNFNTRYVWNEEKTHVGTFVGGTLLDVTTLSKKSDDENLINLVTSLHVILDDDFINVPSVFYLYNEGHNLKKIRYKSVVDLFGLPGSRTLEIGDLAEYYIGVNNKTGNQISNEVIKKMILDLAFELMSVPQEKVGMWEGRLPKNR